MQNVLDFGAKGDGKTLDTAAIQAAINAGGEVYFPKGTYISGTLYLKSGGGLNLAAGAVLRASHDRADYNADDFCEQNSICGQEIGTGAHLIVAVEQENIFIKGEGIIDGDSHYWMNETNPIFDGCIAFARRAAQAGKRCALRLWNLDGEHTQGGNSCNEQILRRLEEVFPRPWKEGWQGTTLAPRVYLEWGERFEWPDLNADDQGQSGFCQGLRDHIGVLWDGTVVPCCLDHEGDIPLGNLYDGSLEDILSSPRARAIYNGFSQGRAAEELCRRCGYRRRFSK